MTQRDDVISGHRALAAELPVVGYQLWYSVPEMRLPLPAYKQIILQMQTIDAKFKTCLNLDDLGQLQALMSASTAMLKAINKAAQGSGFVYFARDLRLVKNIDLSRPGPRETCRLIVREGVDKKSMDPKWQPVELAKLYYHVQTRDERYEILYQGDTLIEPALVKTLDDYRRRTKEVSGTRLRDAIKRAFDQLKPINLRRTGGLYFFRADRKSYIDAAKIVVEKINAILKGSPGMSVNNELCEYDMMEVYGSTINRGMIRESAMADAQRRLRTASDRLADITKRKTAGKEVKDSEFDDAANIAREVISLNKEHRDLLGDLLDQLQEEAKLLMKQVEAAAGE